VELFVHNGTHRTVRRCSGDVLRLGGGQRPLPQPAAQLMATLLLNAAQCYLMEGDGKKVRVRSRPAPFPPAHPQLPPAPRQRHAAGPAERAGNGVCVRLLGHSVRVLLRDTM
jgi:hypothetical protein